MDKKLLLTAALMLAGMPVFAQQGENAAAPSAADVAAMEQRMKEMEERIIQLEGKVRMLQTTQASAATAPAAATPGVASEAAPAPAPAEIAATPGTPPSYGGAGGSAAKALNPDISVIGDFIASAGANSGPPLASLQPFPSFQMHESEIGLQAIIDPYARGDFFVSFGEEGVDLEEGYITFTALPAGFVVKGGKMRSAFGKVNTLHNHVLPWIDRPLVTTNLVGGEDGIDDAGLSVQRIIPMPKGLFMEATAQVFRGDSGDDLSPVFRASRASDVSTVEHLRTYKDLTVGSPGTELEFAL